MATITTAWEVWTYDVWGNARDGYDVNDRRCHDRAHALTLTIDTHNPGKPGEFRAAYPTDKQIRAVFGVRCQIETDGDDMAIYVRRVRDGYPIGELINVSHASLSPIRTLAEQHAIDESLQAQGFDRGSRGCSQCQALSINGTPCHERGCPNARTVQDSEYNDGGGFQDGDEYND